MSAPKAVFAISLSLLAGCLLSAEEDFPQQVQALCTDAEPCPAGMVMAFDDDSHLSGVGSLTVSGGVCFCIDRFEASEGPDGVPESKASRMPWTGVSFDEAKAACEAAGKRLCSGREWSAACVGLPAMRFPYGPELDRGACNDDVEVAPGGSFGGCEGGVPELFDMSGNVAEWAGLPDDPGACGDLGCAAFGGSVEFGMPDLACGLRAGFTRTSTGAAIGFRCCVER